jgi:hypothetical protein
MNVQPGGQLDIMLRQTRWHHATLSSMADMKANMILTVSSVVLTLTVRYLTEPRLKWSAATLMSFCLGSIVLSAWAAMPKLPLRAGGRPDPASPVFNLLFFGDFVRLSYPQFESAMEEMMRDPEKVYLAQVREIYLLGLFLATKKYRFVRLAYLCFITGLVVSGMILVAGA